MSEKMKTESTFPKALVYDNQKKNLLNNVRAFSCEAYGKISITFENGNTYTYSQSRLNLIPLTVVYNNEHNKYVYVTPNGRQQVVKDDIKQIALYKENSLQFLRLLTKDGGHDDIKIIRIEVSILKEKKKEGLFNYLKDTSALNELKASEEDTQGLLEKTYAKIDQINSDSLLAKYLDAENYKIIAKKADDIIIFPFGCNRSQKAAVRNALENNISIIEGPPGTGKTQTILNIIANLIIRKKNVEVVSSNNSAVENVAEKMAKNGIDGEVPILLKDKYSSLGVAFNYPLMYLPGNACELTDEEQAFKNCSWSHIDFLLYRKLDKKPVLAIEVNGYAFHNDQTKQAGRDIIKRSILEKCDIPELVLETVGSNERAVIEGKLDQILAQ